MVLQKQKQKFILGKNQSDWLKWNKLYCSYVIIKTIVNKKCIKLKRGKIDCFQSECTVNWLNDEL